MANRQTPAPAPESIRRRGPQAVLSRLRRHLLPLELAFIIVASVLATSQFLDPNPALKLPGREAEWLTSSAHFAALGLRDYGYLPLWQPYINHGEPLLDNPFSMALNPISTGPSLLVGGTVGVRWSVVLSTVLAALGGWALGRALGLGSLGRVMLGLLMAGRGNMMGMVGTGFFQLGVSQAYMPWILAGAIAILRGARRRLAIVLTAVMAALMFFAGNIYYLLPTLISVAAVTLTHAFQLRRRPTFALRVDVRALAGLAAAGLLALGLSAVTLLPIILQQQYIGGHPSDQGMGQYADLYKVVGRFFDASYDIYHYGGVPGGPQFYHSYILPLWVAALIFLLPLLLIRSLGRFSQQRSWRVWAVGLFMIVFFTLWGAGQNPVVGWLYDRIPFFGQWRFVGRMLAVATFWLAVLAAMRVDTLWHALTAPAWRWPKIRRRLAAALAVVTLAASLEVLWQWKAYAYPDKEAYGAEDRCVDWLRRQHPGAYLSVWTRDYGRITSYLNARVRHAHITASFYVTAIRSRLFQGNLTNLPTEYAMGWTEAEQVVLRAKGYAPLVNSPIPYPNTPCLWRMSGTMAYAFTVPLIDLIGASVTLPVEVTTPVERVFQRPDRIVVPVGGETRPRVAVVQEVAYPGWQVLIDGSPVELEAVGGLIGAVIPADGRPHLIDFVYRPPLLLLGSAITLASALASILILLRVDQALVTALARRKEP